MLNNLTQEQLLVINKHKKAIKRMTDSLNAMQIDVVMSEPSREEDARKGIRSCDSLLSIHRRYKVEGNLRGFESIYADCSHFFTEELNAYFRAKHNYFEALSAVEELKKEFEMRPKKFSLFGFMFGR